MYLNEQARQWTAPDRAVEGNPRTLHETLPGFEATPLREAPGLAEELGVGHVFVKDEHERAGLPAFKILGAAWAVFKALGGTDESLGMPVVDPETRLVCATAGNHGRAVAYLAKLMSIQAHIFIPAGTSQARIEAIRSEGARVQIVDGDYKKAVGEAIKEADRDPKALHAADVGESMSPVWASQGYRTILLEIDEQLGALRPDLVVVPVGAGSFASTVVSHYRANGARPGILAVEPESAACLVKSLQAGELVHVPGPHLSVMAGLNAGDVDGHAWPILQPGVDAAITVTDDEAHQAMRDLASQDIVAGECGAASLAGVRKARKKLQLNAAAVVVLISTEGVHDPAAYREIVSR